MERPAHERRQIEEYVRSQSGGDFEIEHVEKPTSEYVLGHRYDVWDAHTSGERWWVITNPVNLYSQDQIKSIGYRLGLPYRPDEPSYGAGAADSTVTNPGVGANIVMF